MERILAGVRVVEVAQWWFVPAAAGVLADSGHDDPRAHANDYLLPVARGDGSSFNLVANPVQFDETAPTLRPAPDLGQHTEEVLLSLGMPWDDLTAYKEKGAIS